ncbi:MAG: hypothetical protein PHF44_02485 [Candidatus Pacebacteria bacterium]|nr:hypothetical protein [Candidatus Paceibacterota bacterium]
MYNINVGGYLISFFLTVLIEFTVAFIFKYRNKRFFLTILLINLITQPSLNILLWVIWHFVHPQYLIRIFFEIAVVFIEWGLLIYAWPQENKKRLFLLSLIMNLASFAIPYIIFNTFIFRFLYRFLPIRRIYF